MTNFTCTTPGCGNPARTTTRDAPCVACRHRTARYGDPTVTKKRRNGAVTDLLHQAGHVDPEVCFCPVLRYDGKRPTARLNGRSMLASRAVWILHKGDPGDLHVLHKCHEDQCFNLAHLYLGTHARNMRDMSEAGRSNRPPSHVMARGEASGHKLVEAQVRQIRARSLAGESNTSIARDYSVSRRTIGKVVSRETWAHVD